jgi:hypothetical protein
MFLFASVGKAQTTPATSTVYDDHFRVLGGIEGGGNFGNLFMALDGGIEVPIAKRFELDISDAYSPVIHVYNVVIPFEQHVNLGTGSANIANVGGIVWISPGKSLGLNGSAEYSSYSTNISKGSYYAFGGLTWRKVAWGFPVRFTFDYFRQLDNGIACGTTAACALPGANGTESDHVQGGEFGMAVRMGAVGPTVIRMTFSTDVGHTLTQGNPQCDGTFGNTGGPNGGACPRGSAVSGGASMGVIFEFPRHRGLENNPF